MKSYEVIRKALRQGNPKQLAAALGVSLSTVYKWSEPVTENGSGRRNPLDQVALLLAATGDERLLEHLCAGAGGTFVRTEELQLLRGRFCVQVMAKFERKEQPACDRRKAGGARCRYRLADGRCGFPNAGRN